YSARFRLHLLQSPLLSVFIRCSHHPCFFFFYYCAAHRDLHSFPTRRSSDLGEPAFRRAQEIARRVRRQGLVCIVPFGDGSLKSRSEEHTSELQSRGHLVCRLLLEKKNKKKKTKV